MATSKVVKSMGKLLHGSDEESFDDTLKQLKIDLKKEIVAEQKNKRKKLEWPTKRKTPKKPHIAVEFLGQETKDQKLDRLIKEITGQNNRNGKRPHKSTKGAK